MDNCEYRIVGENPHLGKEIARIKVQLIDVIVVERKWKVPSDCDEAFSALISIFRTLMFDIQPALTLIVVTNVENRMIQQKALSVARMLLLLVIPSTEEKNPRREVAEQLIRGSLSTNLNTHAKRERLGCEPIYVISSMGMGVCNALSRKDLARREKIKQKFVVVGPGRASWAKFIHQKAEPDCRAKSYQHLLSITRVTIPFCCLFDFSA